MRITNKSVYIPFQRNIEDVRYRKYKEEVKLETGKSINNLNDAPEKLVNAKQLTSIIDSDQKHMEILDRALGEVFTAHDNIDFMLDKLSEIRQFGIDSFNPANNSNLYSLGVYLKGLINDMLNTANADYNGKYLFSGTSTTPSSIEAAAVPPAENHLPFELIEDTPTQDNLSGLRIVFKGNNNDRIVNKDPRTQEVINTKADELFGEDGTELFQELIKMYNLLSYDENGNQRDESTPFTLEELNEMEGIQQKLGKFYFGMSRVNAHNGVKINRLESTRDLLNEEVMRLKEFRSIEQDTDVTKAALNLKLEETSLAYTLQVGSQLIQNSLFDFLR